MTGATKEDFTTTWVEDAVSGARRDELVPIRVGDDQLGVGYEFDASRRPASTRTTDLDGASPGDPFRDAAQTQREPSSGAWRRPRRPWP